jgi:FkbM family methyltransferase
MRFMAYPAAGLLMDSFWRVLGVKPQRIGSAYGGGWVVTGHLHPGSVVYSFGIGCDISFDEELIARTGCMVFGFDPTPKSALWIREHPSLPANFSFEQVGIAESSGRRLLFLPEVPGHVSGSITKELSGASVDCEFSSLQDIMTRLGHSRVDFVKLDVEGAEYAILERWLMDGVGPLVGQLWVEFHPQLANRTTEGTARLVRRLAEIGLLPAKRAYFQNPNHYLLVSRELAAER